MNYISNKIYKLRLERKWTQKKLAKKTMISQSTICRIENDCSNVKWGIIVKVLNILQNKKYEKLWGSFFKLNEEETILFLEILNKNKKVKSFIEYDPENAAKIVSKILEKKYFENWK